MERKYFFGLMPIHGELDRVLNKSSFGFLHIEGGGERWVLSIGGGWEVLRNYAVRWFRESDIWFDAF